MAYVHRVLADAANERVLMLAFVGEGGKRVLMLARVRKEGDEVLLMPAADFQVNEIDNRGSNFYIALYWAEALAKHDSAFTSLYEELSKNEHKILDELIKCQACSLALRATTIDCICTASGQKVHMLCCVQHCAAFCTAPPRISA